MELITEISEKTGMKWGSVMHAFFGNNIERINPLKKNLEQINNKQIFQRELDKAKEQEQQKNKIKKDQRVRS